MLSSMHPGTRLLLGSLVLPAVLWPIAAAAESGVTLGPFLLDEPGAGRPEPRIAAAVKQHLLDAGFRVNETNLESTALRMSAAREAASPLLVEGFYKAAEGRNLTLYGVVYNAETGRLIDAVALLDEIEFFTKEGVQVDRTELLETDAVRILRFSKLLANRLRANPRMNEMRNQIAEYVLATGLYKRHEIAVHAADRSESQEVFDVLRGPLSSTSTKVRIDPRAAPAMVAQVGAEEIRDYGWLTLNDILYHMPGFAPSMDYDRRTVSSRGMFESWNNSHYLILMDGVQFNDILYGSAYTWEITPLSIVKSLEVIRGPGSALYGSNATNGVISLATYSGADLSGSVSTRLRAGDYGTRIFDLITGNVTEYASYVAAYSEFQTNGNSYMDYDGSGRSVLGYLQKLEVRDARSSDYVLAKFESGDWLKGLSLQYHRQTWNFQTGHGWLFRTPDFSESMSEAMQNLFIAYSDQEAKKLRQEYVVRYQHRALDWNTRYAENGAYDAFYPSGVSEYLRTSASSIFTRGQWTLLLPESASVLAGVEGSVFRYNGDSEHYANADLKNSAEGFPPNPEGFRKQGPWLEWIKNRPIPTGSVFGQIVSGRILRRSVELTVGARYDEQKIRFRGIDQPFSSILPFPYIPEERRVFRRTSPRAGLVIFLARNLNVKLLTAQAFRAPSVTELFGANTFSLASNPRKLKPEIVRTSEAGIDWLLHPRVNLRAGVFRTKFENQIAYSLQNNNLSTNIYTLTTVGGEFEALFNWKHGSAFASVSANRRVSEVILDTTISKSDATTWAPSRTGSVGISHTFFNRLVASIAAQRQGLVRRRASDLGLVDPLTGFGPLTPEGLPSSYANSYPVYRPENVSGWTDVNARMAWKFGANGQAGFSVTNLLNSHQTLVKNNSYPFDYLREGRRFLADVALSF